MVLKIGSFLIATTLAAGTACAQTPRTAIHCTGDATLEYKSLNLPEKTIPQQRTYVLDEAARTVFLVTDGDLVSLCEGKPNCHADFTPAGVQIGYAQGEDVEQLIFTPKTNAIGDQTENATLSTTFRGRCEPVALPPAK